MIDVMDASVDAPVDPSVNDCNLPSEPKEVVEDPNVFSIKDTGLFKEVNPFQVMVDGSFTRISNELSYNLTAMVT